MKKFVVTGGSGFIGSNLVKFLLDKNYFVINIDKLNYRYCELIQSATEEIQQGMRDSIVLNNLSVELAEL